MKKLLAIAAAIAVVAALCLALVVRLALGGDRVKAAIEAQASAALGRPVVIKAATPRIFPRVGLDLTGVTVGGEDVAIERATLSTGLGALFRRRVEDASVLVERSRINVPWALALLVALSRPPQGTAPSSSPLTIVSISRIAFRDVDLVAGPRTLRVDLASSLEAGDRLRINRFLGRSDGSRIEAAGEFSSLARRTGNFKIDAATLDLDGLLTFLAAATPASSKQNGARSPASVTPINVTAAINARSGRVLGADFSSLVASCRIAGDDVRLEDVRVELFGGRYQGTIAFVGSRDPARYEWRGSLEQLDASKLTAFAGAPGSLSGRLGGTLSVTSTGVDPMDAIRRARGTGRMAVTDGRVPGLEIVRAVILAFGKPSAEAPGGSGETFTRLAATLALANQLLSTSDLTFASRDFDLSGAGTLSLASQALDFKADIELSRELSAQAGRDLYRLAREDDRIVLPARITGIVSSPSVSIDIQAALERALRNRVRDKLKSAIDRLRRRINKE